MKSKKAIQHRIEQKTALRKRARQRKRHLFRLAAKANKPPVQPVETIDEAQTRAEEKLFGKPQTKKENTRGPRK